MGDQCNKDAIDTAYREGFASGQYGLIDASPYDPYDPNEANLVAAYEKGFADAIANQWECNCVLPEHSCPACRGAAREIYEEEN